MEASFYEQRDALQVSSYLKGLEGAYLLLLGNYPGSQTLKDEGVRRFLKLVKNVRVELMGRGSHFLPMERPAAVLREIQAFFADSVKPTDR